MAKHLDLEEQEQLDELKHFWNQYGNLITWVLIAVFGSIAAWNGWQYWERRQSAQASIMFDEVERVTKSGSGDQIERAFGDMKERFSGTVYAQQAALLAAKALQEKGKPEAARSVLTWVADKASDEGYQAIARLRLAGLLLEAKAYEDALKQLSTSFPKDYEGLVADRRGDVLTAMGKSAEAKLEYLKAYKALDERAEYRRLVEVKLNALGVDPQPPATPIAAAAATAPSGEAKK